VEPRADLDPWEKTDFACCHLITHLYLDSSTTRHRLIITWFFSGTDQGLYDYLVIIVLCGSVTSSGQSVVVRRCMWLRKEEWDASRRRVVFGENMSTESDTL